jgi:hypothetical protein
MSYGHGTKQKIYYDRLDIFDGTDPRGGIPVMAYGCMSGKSLQPSFIEYISHKTHGFFGVKMGPVCRAYPGPLLPPVLQSVKPQIGKVRCFRMPKNSEDSAFFAGIEDSWLLGTSIRPHDRHPFS